MLVLAARWSRTRRQEATSCNNIERERSKMSRVLFRFNRGEVKNLSEGGASFPLICFRDWIFDLVS